MLAVIPHNCACAVRVLPSWAELGRCMSKSPKYTMEVCAMVYLGQIYHSTLNGRIKRAKHNLVYPFKTPIEFWSPEMSVLVLKSLQKP